MYDIVMCVTIWRASKIERHLFNSVNGFFQIFFTPYDKSLSFLEQSKKILGICNTLYSINCIWTCNRYDKEGWVAVKQLFSVQF